MVALPVRADSGVLHVQIGAFAEYANAESFRLHAVNQLGAAGVESRVRRDRGVFRVLVGPFADRTGAVAAIERILLIFPDAPLEQRDRGYLYYQLGRWTEAARDLEDYLTQVPRAEDAMIVQGLLKRMGR